MYNDPAGWRLSPAYYVNPVPIDVKPRVLSTAIDLDDATASLELALQVANYFEIGQEDANQIAYEVGTAVSSWRGVAAALGIPVSFRHRAFRIAIMKSSLRAIKWRYKNNI